MDEVQELVQYAKLRGVTLLPEFDAPAHAAYGWQFGPEKSLGNLTSCLVDKWQGANFSLAASPPAGQLNPLNPNVYQVRSVY